MHLALTRELQGDGSGYGRSLYKEYGFGFWLIESLSTSGFLGYCGIRSWPSRRAFEREIGWHIEKTFWNQGIATEAAE
jgi:[ribosomal protein S5]-alanine N-acetyltransferase